MIVHDLVITAFVALFIGGLIGTIGIGGVLLTPWLTHVVGLPVREAIVISSFAFIGTGLVAIAISMKSLRDQSTLNWPVVLTTVPGALAGTWALAIIPAPLALALLAVLTIGVGVRSLTGRESAVAHVAKAPLRPGVPVGAVTGFASALTGTGGPMVMMPILLWQGTPLREAVLLGQAVQLPIALTASAGNLYVGGVDVVAGVAIGLLLIPGALLGHRLATYLPLTVLTRLVGVTLIAAGVSFACKAAS